MFNVKNLITIKPNEKVVFALRRHVITFISTCFLTAFLLTIPIILFILAGFLFPNFSENAAIFAPAVILAVVYYLFIDVFFYTHFIDYYLDLWIVTDDRIVDIEQQGVLSRSITELELLQIQDVTTNISGLIRTLFHFGDVRVKTASENTDIVFRDVPYPNRVREQLTQLASADREKRRHPQNGSKITEPAK